MERYDTMALEHLAKNVEVDGDAGQMSPHNVVDGDGGSGMDRD
jgi:hypothetical protein